MRVMHEVTCCSGCPVSDYEYDLCRHPAITHENHLELPDDEELTPPQRCPLRKGDLLISLRVKP